jgi:hypothetical protein
MTLPGALGINYGKSVDRKNAEALGNFGPLVFSILFVSLFRVECFAHFHGMIDIGLKL